jgi:N-acetylneuraminic acid mutarotase
MRIACALSVAAACVAACGDDGGQTTIDGAVADTPSGGGAWSTGTPVAQGAIQETAAVGVAGKIYLIGGFDDTDGITMRVQVYDTATKAWSDGPALPRAVHHANAATDGTTIYVLGALSGTNFTAIGDSYALNPATETQWRTLAAMPGGRERGSAVTDVIGGKVYVAGGFRTVMASDLVDVYDPGTNMWTPLASLPATRDHACGAAIGGRLIVAGGRTVQTNSPRPDVWSYDPGANMWTARAAMPTGRGGMGCGAIGDVLYATGGEGNPAIASGVFADVEAYNPATDTWTELAPMPNPKHGVAGAVWDGALYLCGGADQEGFGAIAATDVFRP